MFLGTRVSVLHSDLKDNTEERRKSRELLYGYVMEAYTNNKYLLRFDNIIEKKWFSNILKIEIYTAAVPVIESASANELSSESCMSE